MAKFSVSNLDSLTVTGGSITGITDLVVADGGTGVSTLTDGGILVGSGVGPITALGVAANGEIPIGDGTTDPTLGTITAGDGIDVTNAAGTITVDTDLKSEGGIVIESGELAMDLDGSNITGTLAVSGGGTGLTASPITVPLGGTGATTLTDHGVVLGSGTAAVSITDSGANGEVLVSNGSAADPDWEYQPKQNLLGNSGFGVWSNSEDLYTTAGTAVGDATVEDATDLILNGNMGSWQGVDPDYPVGWSINGADAGEVSDGGGVMHLHTDAGNEGVATNTYTLTAGKLYEFSGSFTRVSGNIVLRIHTGAGGLHEAVTLTATDTTFSYVFENTSTGASGYIIIWSSGAAEWNIDKVQLQEVTPGIVSATSLGPDGWYVETAADCWREQWDMTANHFGGTYNVYGGSIYSLKVTPNAQNDRVFCKLVNGNYSSPNMAAMQAGRTFTFGAWVKASVASDVKLMLYNDVDGYVYSNNYGILDTWTWLEVTSTMSSTSPTQNFWSGFRFLNASPGTTYISSPMLVFGSSIGEGNYVQPPGEWVYLDDQTGSNSLIYNAASINEAAGAIVYIETLTEGRIPKGIKSLNLRLGGRTATAEKYLNFRIASGSNQGAPTYAQVADKYITHNFIIPCDANGNINVITNNAWTDVSLRVIAVQIAS